MLTHASVLYCPGQIRHQVFRIDVSSDKSGKNRADKNNAARHTQKIFAVIYRHG